MMRYIKSINLIAPDFSEVNRQKIYWIYISLVSVFYLVVSVNTPLSILAWQGYDDM